MRSFVTEAYDRPRVRELQGSCCRARRRVVPRSCRPSVALLGRRAHDRVPHRSRPTSRPLLPAGVELADEDPGRRRDHLGRLAVLLGRGRRAARPRALASTRKRSSSCAARTRGETYSRCVYIWVDKDFAIARGWYQGYPKKLGSIWMTRPVTVGTAGPRLEPGGPFGATLAANDRRLAEVTLTLTGESETGRVRERPADAALAVDAAHRPRRRPRPSTSSSRCARSDVELGPVVRGGADGVAVRSARATSSPRSSPIEMIAGYWRQVGATFVGGSVV